MDTGLFNLLTRQQVYIEGVKNWFAIDLKRYLKLLSDFVRGELNKSGVKTLADLGKIQLTALLKRIDKRTNEILSGFGTEFLAELRRFGRITATAQRASYALLRPKVDLSNVSLSSIWSATKDRVVPAFGTTVKEGAENLINSARAKIRQRLTTGAVDSEAIGDTSDAVASLDPKGDPSTLKTVGAGARGFMATSLQHAAGIASDFVGSAVEDCYQWCSVIDSKTSEICRERNGNVYENGNGPVPPAHNNCRSHTVPCACDETSTPPSYYSWLVAQSSDFLKDAFGASFASKVAERSVNAKDVPDVLAYPALSLDDYELKAKFLTA